MWDKLFSDYLNMKSNNFSMLHINIRKIILHWKQFFQPLGIRLKFYTLQRAAEMKTASATFFLKFSIVNQCIKSGILKMIFIGNSLSFTIQNDLDNAKCIKSHSVEMINTNSKNLVKGKKSRKYYIWIWTGFRHKNSTRVAKTSDAAATYQFLQIP